MRIYGFRAYGGPEVLEFIDVEEPEPGPGQVLITMRAAGVNPADIKVRGGLRRDTVPVTYPMAVGREAAGTVVELGEGVEGLVHGQHVFGSTAAGTGALAPRVLLDASAMAAVPDGVTDRQAACLPVSAGTAVDALDQLAVPEGGTLVVIGAGGGVGTAACQVAAARGVRVLGVASGQKQLVVTRCDAEHIVSGQGWADACRRAAPDGVDAVLDLVGGPVLDAAVPLLADPSRIVSPADPALATSFGGSGVTRRRTGEAYAALAGLVADGTLHPVARVHSFDDAPHAVEIVESGHAGGNIVVSG
ncbi:NADP-dependent oxidoreductase [Actinomycetota bacterium]